MNRPVAVSKNSLDHAVTLLRSGGVVAFPTETYYGLAVDPLNSMALERLFLVKRRPKNLPILVLVAGMEQLSMLTTDIPAVFYRLIDCFWPGPLTLICPAQTSLPSQLTGGTGTVGIRQSPHATANRLIAGYGGPITATSANRTGCEAAVSAEEVARVFGTEIDLILDGGMTPGGSGSTLVGMQGERILCIRPGKIRFSAVQNCIATFTLNQQFPTPP